MSEIGFETHQAELDFLKTQNFPTNPFNTTATNLEQVWENAQKLEKTRSNLPYPIDGMVVKLNDNDLVEKIGVVGKTPRGWCAIKFAAEEVTTKILDITWQVGRTGKISPVAELEPVELAGTTVKRATLHNFKEVVDTEFHAGDTVVIRKAGDIIPEVLQILKNLRPQNSSLFCPPERCPACQTVLVESATGVDLICPNADDCKPQIVKRLAYFCQRNLGNIAGLSEKQIEKFVDKFGIRDIADLYNLPWSKISEMERFGEKSVENLQNSIEVSKQIADYKFLAGLGIDGVGLEVAKLICETIDYSEDD
jgi:DNA ligase (NAD+)